MVKYGEKIIKEMRPEWSNYYLDYSKLSKIISDLEMEKKFSEKHTLKHQSIFPTTTNQVFMESLEPLVENNKQFG